MQKTAAQEGGSPVVIYAAKDLTDRKQAYDLLTLAAGEQWELTALPAMERSPRGKPYFPNIESRHFNLSHSGTLALCVLDSCPVGADIQIVKEHRPGLPEKVCSQGELAWLSQGPDLWRRFALLWTLKEAKVKYTGAGLTNPISAIRVPLPTGDEPLLHLDGLWFRVFSGEDWQGAVCGETPPPDGILWRSVQKNVEKSPLYKAEKS